jgi:hypothetical protein
MAGYRKFSDAWRQENASETLAGLATLAGVGVPFAHGGQTALAAAKVAKVVDAAGAKRGYPPAKVAKVAKVESPEAVCAVCGAAGNLWRVGEALAHEQCAAFLPKPQPAEASLAYEAVSIDPAAGGCSVQIIELPLARRYQKTFGVLQVQCPALVPVERWKRCIEDGRAFLAKWGEQAESFGWDSRDLFGLAPVPNKSHPSFNRLSRYDCIGLVWHLCGRPVVALTADSASIRNPDTGAVTVFRKNNRPALEPVGDSLDDLR